MPQCIKFGTKILTLFFLFFTLDFLQVFIVEDSIFDLITQNLVETKSPGHFFETARKKHNMMA